MSCIALVHVNPKIQVLVNRKDNKFYRLITGSWLSRRSLKGSALLLTVALVVWPASPGDALAQGVGYRFGVIAQAGNDAHARYYSASHACTLRSFPSK